MAEISNPESPGKRTKVQLEPLPAQATMPNPCLDVPKNPWCPKNKPLQPPYPVPGSPAG